MKLFSLPAPSRTDMVIVRLRARPLLHQSQLLGIPKSYHIVGNFQGPYISRIVIKFIFAEINFVDCMIKATPTHPSLAAVKFMTPVFVDTASTRACGLRRRTSL